jgi:hypothetical protein
MLDSGIFMNNYLTGKTMDTIWWSHSMSMFAVGAYFWFRYPHWIAVEPRLRYRNNDSVDYTREDKKWALETREISAWSNISSTLMWGYGISWAVWSLNKEYDNEGGSLHTLSYRLTQLIAYVMPVVLMYEFVKLFNAYDRTLAEDTYDDAVACGSGDCLFNSSFYYKPYTWTDTDFTAEPFNTVFILTNEYHR